MPEARPGRRSRSIADIVRGFGVEPDAVRLISRRRNTHWRVRAGAQLFALRRFGVWSDDDDVIAWEVGVMQALANAGVPAARPIAAPRRIDGAAWMLMSWIGGRRMRHPPTSDADYERLGAMLAEFHLATAHLPMPAQRPGWTSNVEGALPVDGGLRRRVQLLDALAGVDGAMARRFAQAAEGLEARQLPAAFGTHPHRLVHGDFTPWNIRLRGGALAGILDFDLAHVDVRAADVAWARRGYHDPVVSGYLGVAPLDDIELANLDALWLAGSIRDLWMELARRQDAGELSTWGFEWNLQQLDKTGPYLG